MHLSLTDGKTGKDGKTGQSETLTYTPEHPLFVSGRGWVAAGSLGLGSLIVSRAGPLLSVQSVTWEREAVGKGNVGGGADCDGWIAHMEEKHTNWCCLTIN